jgi:hypothetical protein
MTISAPFAARPAIFERHSRLKRNPFTRSFYNQRGTAEQLDQGRQERVIDKGRQTMKIVVIGGTGLIGSKTVAIQCLIC